MICLSGNFKACHANYSPDYAIIANTVPRPNLRVSVFSVQERWRFQVSGVREEKRNWNSGIMEQWNDGIKRRKPLKY
jgi:hypothetical protein